MTFVNEKDLDYIIDDPPIMLSDEKKIDEKFKREIIL